MKTDTVAIHSGFAGNDETGATAVSIYQIVSYAFKTMRQLVDVGFYVLEMVLAKELWFF